MSIKIHVYTENGEEMVTLVKKLWERNSYYFIYQNDEHNIIRLRNCKRMGNDDK